MPVISKHRPVAPPARHHRVALAAALAGMLFTASCEGVGGTALDNSSERVLCAGCRGVFRVGVTPRESTILSGATVQLMAVTWDPFGQELGRPVEWTSSTGQIATVTSAGLVTGTGLGTATITATSEGRSGTATVQVNALLP